MFSLRARCQRGGRTNRAAPLYHHVRQGGARGQATDRLSAEQPDEHCCVGVLGTGEAWRACVDAGRVARPFWRPGALYAVDGAGPSETAEGRSMGRVLVIDAAAFGGGDQDVVAFIDTVDIRRLPSRLTRRLASGAAARLRSPLLAVVDSAFA